MRRSRRGPMLAQRTRFRPRILGLLLLSIVATAIWLVIGDSVTNDSSGKAHRAALGSLGTSTRRPAKPSGAAPPPGITLFGVKPLRIHFKQPPSAGLVFDVRTGQVLWAHRPLKRLPIASLTKIMTAIIVVERTRPNDKALITREALNYSGSGVGVPARYQSG